MKRKGKMRISQMDVPRDPWIDAMPRRATSEEVSNPRPNITPRGYIFHALLHYALRQYLFPFPSIYLQYPNPPLLLLAPHNERIKTNHGPRDNITYRSISLKSFLNNINKHPAPLISNSFSSSVFVAIKIFNWVYNLYPI